LGATHEAPQRKGWGDLKLKLASWFCGDKGLGGDGGGGKKWGKGGTSAERSKKYCKGGQRCRVIEKKRSMKKTGGKENRKAHDIWLEKMGSILHRTTNQGVPNWKIE